MGKGISIFAIALLCLMELALSPAAVAQDVPFKVYITELVQLDDGVDPVLGFIGDYYAKVTINGVEQSNNGACDDETSTGIVVPFQLFKNFSRISECGAPTPWVFTQQVPAGQPVHVKIEIWDSDLASDDHADAKPGDGLDVELDIDPTTGKWTGTNRDAFNWPQDCSRPSPYDVLGGGRVNVCWQASFDTDNDGLLDVWETDGVDTDNDGVVDIDLPALGADPLRKDAFVEVDYLKASDHSHSPSQTAIAGDVRSFANAPVANPDGTTGVQLHVDVGPLYGVGSIVSVAGAGGVTGNYGDMGEGGDEIPEAGNEIIGFPGDKGSGTRFADLKKDFFNSLRETIFRYAIFGHQTDVRAAANDCTSGVASSIPAVDFLVTLGGVDSAGNPCWGTDSGGKSVGFISQQEGTFMHEFGHALGLNHGGFEGTNNKPNYLSVMNYSFQDCRVPASSGLLPGGCDYSRLVSGALLPDLNETDLDECIGIDGGLGFGAVDWNMDSLFEGESGCVPTAAFNVKADINNDGVCVTPGANGLIDTSPAGDDQIKEQNINDGPNRVCDTTADPMTDDVQSTAKGFTPPQPNVLKSFDDWGHLQYTLLGFDPSPGGSGTTPLDEEPDPTAIRESREYMGAMTAPSVTVEETGPATGKPGDVLTYTITMKNQGRGPALSSVLTETAPDGTSQDANIGIIKAGETTTQTTDFTVPSTACPKDSASAAASLAFKDFVGNELIASGSAPLQILDVAAPTLSVTVSPAILWPPEHKLQEVTATIAVEDNCDPNPTVMLVSITSNEPATEFLGEGDKGPDIEGADIGTDDRSFYLRAERGTGRGSTGRVYTIIYSATDSSGNSTETSATVTVPTSNSGK